MIPMSRRRKIIWLSAVLLVLAGGIGGYYWYWESHAIDRKVCQLVYEAAGYPDTKFEKRLRSMKLDFLIREKPKQREWEVIRNEMQAIGNTATPILINFLKDENDSIRLKTVDYLTCIHDSRAMEPLIHLLQEDKSFDVRMNSAFAIGFLGYMNGDKRGTDPLIQALQKDEDELVRSEAAIALGDICDPQAVMPLINALQKEKLGVIRESAAISLGKLGDKKAVQPLIQALQKDEVLLVRQNSAEALGKLGDPQAIAALEETMQKDNDLDVRQSCKDAIAKLKSVSTQPSQTSSSPAETQPAGGKMNPMSQ